jgi:hypothetical protein
MELIGNALRDISGGETPGLGVPYSGFESTTQF